MLKGLKPRLYQESIFSTCAQKNTLVVLPTGMGKSILFVMLAAHRLTQHPHSKVLILAPTKPLADQHVRTMLKFLEISENDITLLTGLIKPEVRQDLWNSSKIIVSTPQGLENDVISGRIKLEDVSLLVFDEAHRAVGDYAYVFLAEQYNKKAKYPRILALTASPGSDLELIKGVCDNLCIEDIEIRSETDPDVTPYIQDVDLKFVYVDLPEPMIEVKNYLSKCLGTKIKEVQSLGFLNGIRAYGLSKKDILSLQGTLRAQMSQGEKDFEVLRGLSVSAELIKIHHAQELLETQGLSPFLDYSQRIMQEAAKSKSKAVVNLAKDTDFKSAIVKAESLHEKGYEHPKLEVLQDMVKKIVKDDVKIIIFNQYRDNALRIVDRIKTIPGAKPMLFVGQTMKNNTGLTQKKQLEILQQFRDGEFNVLVSTSVGEEGLDIVAVDCVIFYEPIPSAIRYIQRKGRTGRDSKGAVHILTTKNTRDEAYKWSAFHKEKRMHRTLNDIKSKMGFSLRQKQDQRLDKFVEVNEGVLIFADHREKGSNVIKDLINSGVNLKLETLNIADYVLSSRVAVEVKLVQDFVDSIIDGRLLEQAKALKTNYEKPLIILEGSEDIYSMRNVHPNAIRGMLATLSISFSIPIIRTRSFKETAAMLLLIAKREQEENSKIFNPHGSRKPQTLRERQEYIISALPGVGATLAKPLLEKFGSVKAVINASYGDLKDVELIGDKKAKSIKELTDSEYEKFSP